MRKALILSLALPICAFSLEEQPWFGNIWEFHFDAAYAYSHYSKIQGGVPRRQDAHDQLGTIWFGVSPTSRWSGDIEAEFAQTNYRSWGPRSFAGQLRYSWWDDVLGDLLSITTGASLRGVTGKSVADVSSPYHSYFNAEVNGSAGKEWSQGPYWYFRTYAFGAVGMANRGSPWARANIYFQMNEKDKHQFSLFGKSYWGFGSQRHVIVDDFHGYAKIHHQSIDVGLGYRYLFDIWGSFDFEYAYRVFAKSYPESASTFTISYNLPFCFF